MSTLYKAVVKLYILVANMNLVVIRNNVACVWDKKCTIFLTVQSLFVCVCVCVCVSVCTAVNEHTSLYVYMNCKY